MIILGLTSYLLGAVNVEAQTSTNNKKTVLITGAASGIDRATAIAFINKGYKTYATDKDTTKI